MCPGPPAAPFVFRPNACVAPVRCIRFVLPYVAFGTIRTTVPIDFSRWTDLFCRPIADDASRQCEGIDAASLQEAFKFMPEVVAAI